MAKRTNRPLRAGDEVIVRFPNEIVSTLDADGTLDGLPFMPEMASLCGKSFRVARRVEKTCVEIHPAHLPLSTRDMRRFPAKDVVFLEEQRCSGDRHDGCRRGCMIFWKEAWLRRVGSGESPISVDERQRDELLKRLTVKVDPTRYFCQSTELEAATEQFPGKQTPWMIWVALREVWHGSRSALEVLGLAAHWGRVSFRRLIHRGDRLLRGPNKRTPTESLNLAPGEWVQIKSRAKILETLNGKQLNRGLRITYAMTGNCGDRFEVRHKVDRMISETTGEMREVQNTVSLRGLQCLCYYEFLGCPRGDFSYWREIWLERVQGAHAGASPPSA